MAKKIKKLEEIYVRGKDLVEFYRENPCIAAHELLGVDLAPIQRLVFRDMWFKSYVITVCSRGFGKTYLLGLLAALSALMYPGNRIGLIGPVFRQCLVITDTYTTSWLSNGLNTGDDIYDNIVPGLTKIQSISNSNIINYKWKNRSRKCITLECSKGFDISGTTDHRIQILDSRLNIVFKQMQDISDGDYAVIKTGFNYFGNDNSMPNFDEFEHNWRTKDCSIPKELTPDLAYWMGLLVGDGCVSVSKNKRKQRVDFVSEDQDLLDSFDRYLREYFLVNKEEHIDRRNRKNDTWEIQYFCKKLVQYLLKCDFTKSSALDKKVPSIIKKASRDIFIAFLQGLFDTDGGVYIQQHKHGYTHCEISFSTSSKQLAKEVHSVLLNLGIISNLNLSNKACIKQLSQGNKPSKCSNGYKVRITNKIFINRFNTIIGFRSLRKSNIINEYINNYLFRKYSLAQGIGIPGTITDEWESKCKRYFDDGYYFVKVISKNIFKAETIDIEVENEHCYWANGFINHNSKMIFHEVEKLYDQSSILREACAKKPTRGSDTCYLKFKSVGGRTPSYIEALPLSDGSKIRGSRFYTIVVDELAQVPDQILDLVLRPMGATALAPMERVRRLEEQNRLIKAGLATADDFEEEKVNKMIMASSGYYKFNHMWRRMKDHWKMMAKAEKEGKECQYSVWQVPYWDLPEGFLDLNNIAEAKRIMSMSEYSMEYEAAMISDSEGFFKASLLDECTSGSDFGLKLTADSNKSYIMGVDPNQGGKASCGVIILEIGRPNKIVNVIELKSSTTQQLTESIQNLCEKYKIVRIFMDRGGGGKAVMDLLEEGYNNKEPILDRENPDNIHKDGRHILEMVNFSTTWISDANFTAKAMFEDRSLLFPELSVSASDMVAKAYKSVEVLKSQLLSIVVTQTATGILHFDTPSKNMNKDLYSALILAAYGARALERELEESGEPILYNSSGMVRPRDGGAKNFSILESGGSGFGSSSSSVSRFGLNTAVLQKKK